MGGCLFIPALSRALFMLVLQLPETSRKTVHGLAERLRCSLSAAELPADSVELVADLQNEVGASRGQIVVEAGLYPTIQVSHMSRCAGSISGAVWKIRQRISSKPEREKGMGN